MGSVFVVADYSSLIRQVRLLMADVGSVQYLDDDQVNGYLALNGDNVRRAAADALDAVATSEALVSKVIKTQDLATDGVKVADSLRAHADRLRGLADADDDRDVFDVVYPPSGCRPELSDYPDQSQVWGL